MDTPDGDAQQPREQHCPPPQQHHGGTPNGGLNRRRRQQPSGTPNGGLKRQRQESETPNGSLKRQRLQSGTPNSSVKRQQQQQSETPNSSRKKQDLILYHYLENLSPIQPFQSVYCVHSLNLPSIPPVFKSPHLNMKKDSKPIYRYPLSDTPKSEFCYDGGEKVRCVDDSNVAEISDHGIIQLDATFLNFLKEPLIATPNKCSPMKEPESFQYNGGSPNHNKSLSHKIDSELATARNSAMEIIENLKGDDKSLCAPELEVMEQNEELSENQASQWKDLLPDAHVALLVDDSSHKDRDPSCATLPSRLSHCTTGNAMATQPDRCHQNASQDVTVEQANEYREKNKENCTSHILSVCKENSMKGESIMKGSCDHPDTSGSKISVQQQRVMRCLTFEMAGTRKIPSIGLHLNTLSSLQKDLIAQDAIPSSAANVAYSVAPFSSFPSGQKTANAPLSSEEGNPELKAQKLPIVRDSSQAPVCEKSDDLSHNSPKKKKRRMENSNDGNSCKRCNCKKSKCLKLYCECFAAGVYCVEPCSCQACLNKPEHEETVIQTRKQIESRNPLAFAPKVIRALEHASEIGEDANKTPASARHKRGCNCKKSSCLKKYCECYQAGVGCSISCRCEGCKNTFGRKHGILPVGAVETDTEEVELDGHEKDVKKPDTEQNAIVQNDEQPLSECLPITPSCTSRSLTQLAFRSTVKPPRSSALTIGSTPMLYSSSACVRSEAPSTNLVKVPSEETPEFLLSKPSSLSGLKVVSPNRKRISPPRTEGGVSPSRKGCRKLILKSIPSFPPLTSDSTEQSH